MIKRLTRPRPYAYVSVITPSSISKQPGTSSDSDESSSRNPSGILIALPPYVAHFGTGIMTTGWPFATGAELEFVPEFFFLRMKITTTTMMIAMTRTTPMMIRAMTHPGMPLFAMFLPLPAGHAHE